MMELIRRRKLVEEAVYQALDDACFHIGNMLYRMIVRAL